MASESFLPSWQRRWLNLHRAVHSCLSTQLEGATGKNGGATHAIGEQQAAIAIIRALRDEITKPLGEPQWKKLDWLFRRVCDAFKADDRIRKYRRKGLNDGV
jgi:hypothetical protein